MILDVRNASNSLRWANVLYALEHRFHVPEYLLRMIRDDLSERVLIYDTTNGPEERPMQDLNLGPTLWNVNFNDILKLKIHEDAMSSAFLIAYADFIVAIRA